MVPSERAVCAIVTAGVTRDARASVTSLRFVDAKPRPAVTAKTKVTSQSIQPTSEAARWRACQRLAAQEGIPSAIRSAATPSARKSHPSGGVAGAKRSREPPVDCRADGGDAKVGGVEQDREELAP